MPYLFTAGPVRIHNRQSIVCFCVAMVTCGPWNMRGLDNTRLHTVVIHYSCASSPINPGIELRIILKRNIPVCNIRICINCDKLYCLFSLKRKCVYALRGFSDWFDLLYVDKPLKMNVEYYILVDVLWTILCKQHIPCHMQLLLSTTGKGSMRLYVLDLLLQFLWGILWCDHG